MQRHSIYSADITSMLVYSISKCRLAALIFCRCRGIPGVVGDLYLDWLALSLGVVVNLRLVSFVDAKIQ